MNLERILLAWVIPHPGGSALTNIGDRAERERALLVLRPINLNPKKDRPLPNQIYWLNFRIEDGDVARKPNHKSRYEAVVEVVEEYALTWWRQSPSLYIFDTNINLENLAPVFTKCINPECDYILLGQLGAEKVVIHGRYNDKDIFQIVPFLKEL